MITFAEVTKLNLVLTSPKILPKEGGSSVSTNYWNWGGDWWKFYSYREKGGGSTLISCWKRVVYIVFVRKAFPGLHYNIAEWNSNKLDYFRLFETNIIGWQHRQMSTLLNTSYKYSYISFYLIQFFSVSSMSSKQNLLCIQYLYYYINI